MDEVCRIVDLRNEARHLPAIAAWIHEQWWSGSKTSVEDIEAWLEIHLEDALIPTTFVATSGAVPIGSVCLHETEAPDRPAYWPYLGALYVRPADRRRGTGAALVGAVEAHASRHGYAAIYLNAADAMVGFYEARNWLVVERRYGPKRLTIMRRQLG
ncbi:MAG: GNAT family N-acetyltransferase [Rhizobiales bacterium]|nr:GNAT family N-acetyltransferase [Hyphomicrobiales bacterium]